MDVKQSKNLGIRKACPSCKKTVIVDGNFEGKGKFGILCPHCYKAGVKTLVMIEINKKTTMNVTKILSFLAFLLIGFYIGLAITSDPTLTELPYAE